MLNILRNKKFSKKVLWGVFIIIVISFGFLGSASYLSYGKSSVSQKAGEIFGKSISISEYQQHLAATEDRALMLYKDQYFKLRQYLNLEQETWDRIILFKEAGRRGYKASDEDVVGFIQQMPMFQRDGQFDRFVYQDILHDVFRRKPRDFEESIRDQLVIQKLFDQESSKVSLDDSEILDAYTKKNEKIQASYVFIANDEFKGKITLNDQDLKNYYTSHKEEFFLPPSINLETVKFDFPADASADVKKAASDKAYLVYEELTSNSDFDAVVAKHDLVASTSGFFSQESPNLGIGLPFEALQKAFSFNIGQISEPIETPQGYLIFRLKEKKDASVPEFKDVIERVRESLLQTKAQELARKKAEEIYPELTKAFEASSPKNFANAAHSIKLSIEQTPYFGRGEYLPSIGASGEFQEAAFELKNDQEISGIVQAPKGFCILHRDGTQDVDMEKFAKDKETFSKEILSEKVNAHLVDFLAQLKKQADFKDDLKKDL